VPPNATAEPDLGLLYDEGRFLLFDGARHDAKTTLLRTGSEACLDDEFQGQGIARPDIGSLGENLPLNGLGYALRLAC
jgi:hypothetical protein